MNYTISMTDILLAVSVGCNLWFLFLRRYAREGLIEEFDIRNYV